MIIGKIYDMVSYSSAKRILLALSLSIPVAYAQNLANAFEPLFGVFEAMFQLLSFGWLSPGLESAAVKFLMWLVTFVILGHVLSKPFEKSPRVKWVIAFAFSSIAIIFLPDELALFAGNIYADILGLIFTLAIPGLLIFWVFRYTKDWEAGVGKLGMRILGILFGMAAVNGIANFLGFQGGVTGFVGQTLGWINAVLGIMFIVYMIGFPIQFFRKQGTGFGAKIKDAHVSATKALGGATKTVEEQIDAQRKRESVRNARRKERVQAEIREKRDVSRIVNDFLDISNVLALLRGLRKPRFSKKLNREKLLRRLDRDIKDVMKRYNDLINWEKQENDSVIRVQKEIADNPEKYEQPIIKDAQDLINDKQKENQEIQRLDGVINNTLNSLKGYLVSPTDEQLETIHKGIQTIVGELQNLEKLINAEKRNQS